MTRGVQVVMSTHINSVPDALMSALIAVDIDTTWRFLTKHRVVVMDTTAIQEKFSPPWPNVVVSMTFFIDPMRCSR